MRSSRRSFPGAAHPTRIAWVGTYERDYPRTRVLIAGLRAAGVDVVEIHRPVWETTTHKTGDFLRPNQLARSGARWAAAWARTLPSLRSIGPVDVVVAGYPAQPDAVPARVAAQALKAPLVVDAMISLSDTLAGDREQSGRVTGFALAGVDRAMLAAADLVMTDTPAHADWFAQRFRRDPSSICVVPVGAEPDHFPPSPVPAGPFRALFYGKLAPLHGIATIVDAARISGVPPIRLVGDGQLGSWLQAELARDRPPALEHLTWVPYDRLGTEVAAATVCLGVFGQSEKAGRVVPNKVYQALAAGRAVVTADTAGVRDVVRDGVEGMLVPSGSPVALADALRRLDSNRAEVAAMGAAAHRRFLDTGHPDVVARQFLDALRRRFGGHTGTV